MNQCAETISVSCRDPFRKIKKGSGNNALHSGLPSVAEVPYMEAFICKMSACAGDFKLSCTNLGHGCI